MKTKVWLVLLIIYDIKRKEEWHIFNVYIAEAKNYGFSVNYVYIKWQNTKIPHKSESKLKSLWDKLIKWEDHETMKYLCW